MWTRPTTSPGRSPRCRSTSGFTGFTILMSAVPELGTAPLYRSYFGVQFNDDGTETLVAVMSVGYKAVRYVDDRASDEQFAAIETGEWFLGS